LRYDIWLSLILGPCNHKLISILESFGGFKGAYELKDTLEFKSMLTKGELLKLEKVKTSDVERIADYCEKSGVYILNIEDDLYPENLLKTKIPPAVLYVTGDVKVLNSDVIVAGVGTRNSTQYGRDAVRLICEPLAKSGIVLVSGMAYGIDSEVHMASLRNDKKTIAVMGTGIDRTYPARHGQLRQRIEKTGAVISEYPPFFETSPYLFPVRNRLISGLAVATIIFEAEKRSGTMSTAGWALDDGREVFAVPGGIMSPKSEGTNILIKQGAHPALSALDILNVLGMEACESEFPANMPNSRIADLSKKERVIYDILSKGEADMDYISEKTGMLTGELLSVLGILEIENIVMSLPGNRYRLR